MRFWEKIVPKIKEKHHKIMIGLMEKEVEAKDEQMASQEL